MPELPEVETMRRGVAVVLGGCIAGVERPPCACRPILMRPGFSRLRGRLLGATIVAAERLGKRLILVFDSEDRLVIEPRMTGLLLVTDPPTTAHLRLRLRLEGTRAPQLLFWDRRGLGTVRLLSPREFTDQLGPARIGPDALGVVCAEFQTRLASSRRAIKVALLDQQAIAGVGNLYASEMLHGARIDPRTRCDQLSARQWRRLHASMQRVLRAAIRYEGSTLSDGTYRNALNQSGGYQNHHRVYDRAGERCPTCRQAEIQRIVQAQRSTFLCPRCQTTSP